MWAVKLARLWCRLTGHRWEEWTRDGHLRCAKCLEWKAGHPPFLDDDYGMTGSGTPPPWADD